MATKSKIEVEITGKDKASGTFKKIGGSLTKMGKIATGFGVIGAAGLFAITKAAANFEGKMREVNSMIGLSEKDFTSLSEEVQNVAKEVGKSTGEMSEALYQIVSAGVPAADAIFVLGVAGRAAVAGVTDVSTAADGLTTVLNAFKISATEAEHVADVLFTTVKGGKTTFAELSASLFNVAPIAATAGIKFETIAAALATMTKQGIPTSVATTQLRAAIQALIKPTADMSAAISALGFESGEAMIAELGFQGAINALVETADGSLETLGKMFGSVEGLSAILSLTGENAATFSADLEAMANASGAAMEAYTEINKGAGRQFEILWNKVKIFGEELGMILLPILVNILGKMTGVLDKVADWAKEHPKLTEAIVLFGAALTGIALVGGPLMMFSRGIKSIMAVGKTFVVWIGKSMIPALIRLASSFIATLAAMGPAGWAAIAAGALIATGAIAGLVKMLGGGGGEGVTGPTFISEEERKATGLPMAPHGKAWRQGEGGWYLESYQHGGIVPGPLGAPIPIIAHGGEAFGGVRGEAFGDTYNIYFPNYLGDREEITEILRVELLKIKSRNFTTGL